MSIIFSLLFLLSFTSSVLSTNNDEIVLLKLKQQLGDPDELQSWVEGFNYCETHSGNSTAKIFIGCADMGTIRVITMLIFENLDITSPFPNAICSLTELEHLEIGSMPGLYGPIPSCITKLINLGDLSISGTSLSGSIPSFYNHSNIRYIYLANNSLSGNIPPSLSTLPKLDYLELSSNYLTGPIPPGLVHNNLYLSSLGLFNNNLTGELPKCYGLLDFWRIDLRNNQLSGDASFLLGKKKRAVNIALANNHFEFDLSHVEFSDNLAWFDVSHNKIYGRVPESFATAAMLYHPNLSSNRLCGELPQSDDKWRFNAAVFADNACLCGFPLPPCSISAPTPAPMSEPSF